MVGEHGLLDHLTNKGYPEDANEGKKRIIMLRSPCSNSSHFSPGNPIRSCSVLDELGNLCWSEAYPPFGYGEILSMLAPS